MDDDIILCRVNPIQNILYTTLSTVSAAFSFSNSFFLQEQVRSYWKMAFLFNSPSVLSNNSKVSRQRVPTLSYPCRTYAPRCDIPKMFSRIFARQIVGAWPKWHMGDAWSGQPSCTLRNPQFSSEPMIYTASSRPSLWAHIYGACLKLLGDDLFVSLRFQNNFRRMLKCCDCCKSVCVTTYFIELMIYFLQSRLKFAKLLVYLDSHITQFYKLIIW